MPTLVANSVFEMTAFLENGDLADFFDSGTVGTHTSTQFDVSYSDGSTTQHLTLTGQFGNYVDGYPTSGTITHAVYSVGGTDVFTLSDMSYPVSTFTQYVLADDMQGLFSNLLSGNDHLVTSHDGASLWGFAGDDLLDGAQVTEPMTTS